MGTLLLDILWITLGIVALAGGIVGCVLPALPGPPIAYLGLVFLKLSSLGNFHWIWLLAFGILTVIVFALDYIVPAMGTKKFGGTKAGVWGSTVGLLVGIVFFAPWGIILGPFIGAFLFELIGGMKMEGALKSAWGSFVGFLLGTGLKLIVCFIMAGFFIWELFV